MNDFVYHIPTKVYFGQGHLDKLGGETAALGHRALLVYGGGSIKRTGLYDRVTASLRSAGVEFVELPGVDPNPRISSVEEGARLCKEHKLDVIVAVGGGSVIDCSKVIAAGAFFEGDLWTGLVRKGVEIDRALPIVSVLTLSATGSEMDTAAVISNPATCEKRGMGHPLLRPRVSFLDPSLTYSVSPFQTACGSADILSHILEVYFAPEQGMELLDRQMEGMMRTVIHCAPIALREPENYDARANLMWTSSWAINGFVAADKRHGWSCHPMEHELSAFYDIAHGLGLAILTPRWMEYVLDETTAPRFYTYGVNVFGLDPSLSPMEAARESIRRTADFLSRQLGLPDTLTKIGIDETNFDRMAEKACVGGEIHGFKPLTPADVRRIYESCL